MLFTCEQVSAGHPDKICDQISDAIVTDCLQHDKNARVGIECMIKGYDIMLGGEITSRHAPDYLQLAKDVLWQIGLPHVEQYHVFPFVTRQSEDIALGVDRNGAGDQGIMYGYATDETPEMLPIPFVLATKSLQMLRDFKDPRLLPDAKAQVTYDYHNKRIHTFLISTQHAESVSVRDIYPEVVSIMSAAAEQYGLNRDFHVLVNPTGRFVRGSSFADTGVTGRKIMCDTYGGMCRHGGGAFSGKDPTKVDRSAAYMARKIARDLVSNGFCHRCEVQLAYAIGLRDPLAVSVYCYGTHKIPVSEMVQYIQKHYDLSVQGMIDFLHLKDVNYNLVSTYGHFGKTNIPWEK